MHVTPRIAGRIARRRPRSASECAQARRSRCSTASSSARRSRRTSRRQADSPPPAPTSSAPRASTAIRSFRRRSTCGSARSSSSGRGTARGRGQAAPAGRLAAGGNRPRGVGVPVVAPFARNGDREARGPRRARHARQDALHRRRSLGAWVQATLFEKDLARVRTGAAAEVTVTAYPKEAFRGRVAYIGAVLDKETRTVPARIEVAQRRRPAQAARCSPRPTIEVGRRQAQASLLAAGRGGRADAGPADGLRL